MIVSFYSLLLWTSSIHIKTNQFPLCIILKTTYCKQTQCITHLLEFMLCGHKTMCMKTTSIKQNKINKFKPIFVLPYGFIFCVVFLVLCNIRKYPINILCAISLCTHKSLSENIVFLSFSYSLCNSYILLY